MQSPIKEISNIIFSDGKYREIAARAVKHDVDYVYGYSKYSVREVDSELDGRLYSPEYLGVAVNALLDSDVVKRDVKVKLARQYISAVKIFLNGKLPKESREWWDGMEPVMVVEAAAYLDHEGLFDWDDVDAVGSVIALAHNSQVRAKGAFLSSLIQNINTNRKLLNELYTSYMEFGFMGLLNLTRADKCGMDRIKRRTRNLISNLDPLIDADFSSSSIAPIVKLNALTDSDLIAMFASYELSFKKGNRVLLHRDFATALHAERGISLVSLLEAFEECIEDKRGFYPYEPKLLALSGISDEMNVEGRELAKKIKKYLWYHMETDTRLKLMQFVYRHTGDKEVLRGALSFKSSKIRKWVEDASLNPVDQA